MKRALLAVCGLLLSGSAWAGGGHFSPHMGSSPLEAHENHINRLSDIIAGPYRHAINEPHDIIVGPYGHAINEPHDIIVGPYGHAINGPHDIIVGPYGHATSDAHETRAAAADTTYEHLVKPAWQE